MQIWKLLSAKVVTLVLFICLPIILGTYGLMPPLNSKAVYILAITAVGLLFKIVANRVNAAANLYNFEIIASANCAVFTKLPWSWADQSS